MLDADWSSWRGTWSTKTHSARSRLESVAILGNIISSTTETLNFVKQHTDRRSISWSGQGLTSIASKAWAHVLSPPVALMKIFPLHKNNRTTCVETKILRFYSSFLQVFFFFYSLMVMRISWNLIRFSFEHILRRVYCTFALNIAEICIEALNNKNWNVQLKA